MEWKMGVLEMVVMEWRVLEVVRVTDPVVVTVELQVGVRPSRNLLDGHEGYSTVE